MQLENDTKWLELRIAAEQFHDAQKQRIAATNRLSKANVHEDLCSGYIEALVLAEAAAKKQMVGSYRINVPKPIQEWVKETMGLGEPSMARLLGHLGHPVIATPHHWEGTGSKRVLVADDPFFRSVSQLWQYCGHGAPGRLRRGMSASEVAAMGSPNLKMLVHLISENAGVKSMSSPYRLVYEQTKEAVADKTHTVECVRCGPSGKPAQPGSPWSKGHQHAHALRVVGKEILRDLWVVSMGDLTEIPSDLSPVVLS